jgi:hypothetical protein
MRSCRPALRYTGSFLANNGFVESQTSDEEVTENEIEHKALGDTGRPARPEFVGLFVYLASMAGFLFWLLRYGVNV